MTLEQYFSNHMTYKGSFSSKFGIGQWYLIAYFSKKMIFTKPRYKTYDQELPAIVEAFKTWHDLLEDYKYEVFVLTDHNNLCQFMDRKSFISH